MAEAVGLAASLASLIEISGSIIAAGYGYVSKVAHGPSRIHIALSTVSCVKLFLVRFEHNFVTPLHIVAELAMENLVDLFLASGASTVSPTCDDDDSILSCCSGRIRENPTIAPRRRY